MGAPNPADLEAALAHEQVLKAALSVRVTELQEEIARLEGKNSQLVEWLSNFADEWNQSVEADDTAFEMVNDLREHLETLT